MLARWTRIWWVPGARGGLHERRDRRRPEALENAPLGHGRPTLPDAGLHPVAGDRVAADGEVDRAAFLPGRATDDREVVLLDRPCGELPRERVHRLRGLRDDDDAGRVLVEPVHDPRALRIRPVASERPAVEERRDEGSVARARRRMRRHAGRLVDRDEARILVEHDEGDRLRLHARRLLGRQFHLDRLARRHGEARLARHPVHPHEAGPDERRDPRARRQECPRGEHSIEAAAGLRGRDPGAHRARRVPGEASRRILGARRAHLATPRIRRAAAASSRIWATSRSTESNFASPRSRASRATSMRRP